MASRDFETISKAPYGINITYTKQSGYQIAEKEYNGIEIEQVLEPFEILSALNLDTGISQIVITEKYNNKGTQHLYKLINAIRKNLMVSFNYGKYSAIESSSRILAPYHIKQVKGQWYLIGKSPDAIEINSVHSKRMLSFLKIDSRPIAEKY